MKKIKVNLKPNAFQATKAIIVTYSGKDAGLSHVTLLDGHRKGSYIGTIDENLIHSIIK